MTVLCRKGPCKHHAAWTAPRSSPLKESLRVVAARHDLWDAFAACWSVPSVRAASWCSTSEAITGSRPAGTRRPSRGSWSTTGSNTSSRAAGLVTEARFRWHLPAGLRSSPWSRLRTTLWMRTLVNALWAARSRKLNSETRLPVQNVFLHRCANAPGRRTPCTAARDGQKHYAVFFRFFLCDAFRLGLSSQRD